MNLPWRCLTSSSVPRRKTSVACQFLWKKTQTTGTVLRLNTGMSVIKHGGVARTLRGGGAWSKQTGSHAQRRRGRTKTWKRWEALIEGVAKAQVKAGSRDRAMERKIKHTPWQSLGSLFPSATCGYTWYKWPSPSVTLNQSSSSLGTNHCTLRSDQ